MAMVTGLSGNEIYCLAMKDLAPGEIVVGNSVQSMGFLGAIASGFRGVVGGEIEPISQAVEAGRQSAFDRMISEAKAGGAAGVTGVTGELKDFAGSTEFLFVGSAVMQGTKPATTGFFSSRMSASSRTRARSCARGTASLTSRISAAFFPSKGRPVMM